MVGPSTRKKWKKIFWATFYNMEVCLRGRGTRQWGKEISWRKMVGGHINAWKYYREHINFHN